MRIHIAIGLMLISSAAFAQVAKPTDEEVLAALQDTGRFQVVMGGASILVDTVTGKTWRLAREGETAVWLPILRNDADWRSYPTVKEGSKP